MANLFEGVSLLVTEHICFFGNSSNEDLVFWAPLKCLKKVKHESCNHVMVKCMVGGERWWSDSVLTKDYDSGPEHLLWCIPVSHMSRHTPHRTQVMPSQTNDFTQPSRQAMRQIWDYRQRKLQTMESWSNQGHRHLSHQMRSLDVSSLIKGHFVFPAILFQRESVR